MRNWLDLNCDLAEGVTAEEIARDEQLMQFISSANLCGGAYAGDRRALTRCVAAAVQNGVAIGAHPGYPDRRSFGRQPMLLSSQELGRVIAQQLATIAEALQPYGVPLQHVKLHGALYHQAARCTATAAVVVEAVQRFSPQLWIFAPADSCLLEVALAHGVAVAREIFLDRSYLPNGELVPRTREDALLLDPAAAARRLSEWLRTGRMSTCDGGTCPLAGETACVHSDQPGVLEFVRVIRERLRLAGVTVVAPAKQPPTA